jgi:hypothetical protein
MMTRARPGAIDDEARAGAGRTGSQRVGATSRACGHTTAGAARRPARLR